MCLFDVDELTCRTRARARLIRVAGQDQPSSTKYLLFLEAKLHDYFNCFTAGGIHVPFSTRSCGE